MSTTLDASMNIFSVEVPMSYGVKRLESQMAAEVLPDGISFVPVSGQAVFEMHDSAFGGSGVASSLMFGLTGNDAAALKCFGAEMQRRYRPDSERTHATDGSLNREREDWGVFISEFSAGGNDIASTKATSYDPEIGRYFYRRADGIKVIVG